ncbi:unnamed protein product [Linum tenue]|uniref:Uncharacterized protein n=1 Tax=Linum tenue TaxID=586396 RepID=A0AAV0S6B9_9ROSI|nr:unnamed protein product [Linum tenue]CAI0415282.1 unnamed protein product [Linum tenue]CAI0628722.1 unnamed protein product [Linum tenue]
MAKVLQVEIEAEEEKIEEISETQFGLFTKQFARRHGLHLVGTAVCWFLLDIAYYSSNLFQKDIFSAIGWIPPAKTMNAVHEVYVVSRAQTLIALCGTVPGYWFTHHWTLKANRIGFLVMYSLTFFFANFGPNATTFVVPAEIFPARLRSTCHGFTGRLLWRRRSSSSITRNGFPPRIWDSTTTSSICCRRRIKSRRLCRAPAAEIAAAVERRIQGRITGKDSGRICSRMKINRAERVATAAGDLRIESLNWVGEEGGRRVG